MPCKCSMRRTSSSCLRKLIACTLEPHLATQLRARVSFWSKYINPLHQSPKMSSYTPRFDAFAYSFAPLHAACSAQRPPLAACSREASGAYKSSIGTAFDTAASTGEAAHTLPALEELVLEYVRSLMSKYSTLRDSRRQQAGACDRDSRHLLLQQELALLHEIIDLQHDMQELQRQHAQRDVVVSSSHAIWTALVSLR